MAVSISIIIPVYQVEPYIRRCLESVMSQDTAPADMECILVDDCGSDCSMEIVREAIAAYQGPIRFTVIAHEQNRGLSAARNTGLAEATGDYILFIDSDDYMLPGSISYFLEQSARYTEVDMIIGNTKVMKNHGSEVHDIKEPWLIDHADVILQRLLRHQINAYAWNKLIRRRVLTDHDIRFEEGIIYEDLLWAYQLFSHLSSVLLLPQATYCYEENPQSIVATTYTQEKADRAVWSYTVSANRMLDLPPNANNRFQHNLTADYLLYITNFLMKGSDIRLHCQISEQTVHGFLTVRRRLLLRSLRYGRLLVALFALLLFQPLDKLQKWHWFRINFFNMERLVSYMAHLTDCFHGKSRV